MYDYLIVGTGLFGSVCAYELKQAGFSVCMVEKRNHIGGNCYTNNRDGIHVHEYGPHIFHTSNQKIWNWINQFATFNNFRLSPAANYNGEIYSLPFSMWTFNKLWGIGNPEEAKNIIQNQSAHISEPRNLEEQAIKLVGTDIYEKLIKGYTEKQWKKSTRELPSSIIKRLPVRFTYDNNYFNDTYQGIPIGGYTQIFEKLLEGIPVLLNTDFFTADLPSYKKLIYTGPIDKFFNYRYGSLEYKTTKFDHVKFDIENYQGIAVMNYTSKDIPYTRTIEHKHFDYAPSINHTWVTWEYPTEYISDVTDPYYPVNDSTNDERYKKYRKLADALPHILFGGRLAEYKYYDMHQVIASALKKVHEFMNRDYV
jgi:UDP-galactopyranose mutase